MSKPANIINHIVMVLDASSSMGHLTREMVKVVDAQVAYLAQRSKELDQETRVTIYVFADTATCIIYDMDVLRLPSIAKYYRPNGMTALIDATRLALHDLADTLQKYGDHAFLVYVFTDGANNIHNHLSTTLAAEINALADNWTVACLVPNQNGVFEAKRFGFPKDNVAVWDATSARGVTEAGETVRRATDTFMVNRAAGVRSSRAIFSTGADAVNAATIKAAALTPLGWGTYVLVPVPEETTIKEFAEQAVGTYRAGSAYYQLMKAETIQGHKQLAIVAKKTGKVYTGDNIRNILGLPDMHVRVKPDANPLYDIYVQSTSVNRKLIPGTKLLLLGTY